MSNTGKHQPGKSLRRIAEKVVGEGPRRAVEAFNTALININNIGTRAGERVGKVFPLLHQDIPEE